jgi:hypothetical protein
MSLICIKNRKMPLKCRHTAGITENVNDGAAPLTVKSLQELAAGRHTGKP